MIDNKEFRKHAPEIEHSIQPDPKPDHTGGSHHNIVEDGFCIMHWKVPRHESTIKDFCPLCWYEFDIGLLREN